MVSSKRSTSICAWKFHFHFLNSQTDAYIRVKKYENIISCLVHGHGSFPLLCHSLPPNNTTEQTKTIQNINQNLKKQHKYNTKQNKHVCNGEQKQWWQTSTYKVRNEIETKRNQRKRNETKRNQRNENEIKRNQRKQNEINENKTK